MVDSGAAQSFMDEGFAKQHQVPMRPKDTPLLVEGIDGRLLKSGPVVQETCPLQLHVLHHQEPICFNVARMPRFPVVLGLSWLREHNPLIDWSQGELQFHVPCKPVGCTLAAAATEGRDLADLPEEYRDFSDVFEEKGADQLPPHRPYDCAINLEPGAPLPVARVYPMSEPELEALREFLAKNLKRGFIRPSTSPLSAPIIFVKKKSGELRPCNDYRALNKITIRDKYPLPLISELLDRVKGAQVFTKLDLRGAYNLVRIKAGDEWKTAFKSRYGIHEHLVMPFGLSNSPAVFQRMMNDIFQDMLDQGVVVYLDDILIYSRDHQQHVQDVRRVLLRLRQQGLFAKLEKCEFHIQEGEFLGHIISPQGIRMDPRKVETVVAWRPPRNRKDVQRFLGFANYYRQFIPGYADITAPITRLLRPKEPFQWTEPQERAFQLLKTRFVTQPLLRHPDPQLAFVVETDASSVALGAVLSQREGPDSPLRPCAYYSRQLSPAERNYTIWERELLAIRVAFDVWRHYLEGARHPVLVLTDHRNLEHLQTARRLSQRQIRWSLFFSRFHFRIQYIPQHRNKKADALSRKPEYEAETEEAPLGTILPPSVFGAVVDHPSLAEDIRARQARDAWVQQRLHEIQPGNAGKFASQQGLLTWQGRVYVPEGPLRTEVMQLAHDVRPAGHFGHFKTLHLLTREFWWPRVRADVQAYVRTCATCRRGKDTPGKPAGLLQPLPTPTGPWDTISMDFIVDLPRSRGHTCIAVFVDLFTKMAHFVPCPKIPTAPETAHLYLHHIFKLHGLPSAVISDRGSQFTSHFWRALHLALGTRVRLSTAFHPQTDGQTERTNATLEQFLRCYGNYQQNDWADLLPLAEFAYNNAVHSSTQQTPFMASYGHHPRSFPATISLTPVPAVNTFTQELEHIHALLREQLAEAKRAYSQTADRKRQVGPPITVGKRAWLSTRYLRSSGRSKKLGPRFIGPYEVLEQLNPVAFRLRLPDTLHIHPVFHRSLLIPEADPDPIRPAPPDPPAPELFDGEEEYEVQQILDSRMHRGALQYLVDWQGYGPEDRSWEPAENLHTPELLQQFHACNPDLPGPLEGGPLGEGDSVRAVPLTAPLTASDDEGLRAEEVAGGSEQPAPAAPEAREPPVASPPALRARDRTRQRLASRRGRSQAVEARRQIRSLSPEY